MLHFLGLLSGAGPQKILFFDVHVVHESKAPLAPIARYDRSKLIRSNRRFDGFNSNVKGIVAQPTNAVVDGLLGRSTVQDEHADASREGRCRQGRGLAQSWPVPPSGNNIGLKKKGMRL